MGLVVLVQEVVQWFHCLPMSVLVTLLHVYYPSINWFYQNSFAHQNMSLCITLMDRVVSQVASSASSLKLLHDILLQEICVRKCTTYSTRNNIGILYG